MTWPFADPPNVAVFTSRRILDGADWIHYVTHDEDDGAWQFHPSAGPTTEEEAAVVALKTIVDHDPSIAALADLPIGWHAWRTGREGAWQRSRITSASSD
jgi:hypothetical protein